MRSKITRKFISSEMMDTIASYMDDEKREHVHNEMAPCKNVEFLREYVKLDPGFTDILETEFNIDMEELKEIDDLSMDEIRLMDYELLTEDEIKSLEASFKMHRNELELLMDEYNEREMSE